MRRGLGVARGVCAVLGVLGLAVVATPAAGACMVQQIVELKVTMEGHSPMVTAQINGRDARFMADSGAFYSMISPGGAAEFHLKDTSPAVGLRVMGVGGEAEAYVTTVKTLTLAGVPVSNIQFIVAGSETGGVGLLGQNVLGLADAEYDLSGGAIRLMKPKDCAHKILAYWAGPSAISTIAIDPATPSSPHTMGEVWVNGVKLRAMFDTGAGSSVLSLRAAARAGVKPGNPGVEPDGWSSGVGRNPIRIWAAPIDSFKAGDEEVHHTRLQIGDIGMDDVDMLVGADFFLSHRVYVANSQRRMYFTYNGGPVFNLNGTATVQDAKDQAPRASPTASRDVDPTDADGFSRRGAAFAARRDLEHALADLDQACKLAPGDARYLYQRALLRLEYHQPLLALSDLDQVLKLQPGHVEALVTRAELRLIEGDHDGVRRDLDAASAAAPAASDLRLRMADVYSAAEAFEAALPLYDQWIKVHPDDARMGEALNGRCWARATLNRELDKALADCNAAARRLPRSAAVLDSRGLVRLRRGDLDKAIADYDAALALRPASAWSLFGRGVARQRKGLKADGDADIAAAIKLRPKVAEEARRYGVVS
ncbi:MAG: aspartyl protease family protein [Proteobacteria bacterium]|nr:aspartyl protease family protein [Pseudomonadota bacterium]